MESGGGGGGTHLARVLRELNVGRVKVQGDRLVDVPAVDVDLHVKAAHPIVALDLKTRARKAIKR